MMRALAIVCLGLVMSMSQVVFADYTNDKKGLIKPHEPRKSAPMKNHVMSIVDINHANEKELMSLKGVGKKRAKSIIAYRTKNGLFASINVLAKVNGVGEKGLAKLQKNNPGRIT